MCQQQTAHQDDSNITSSMYFLHWQENNELIKTLEDLFTSVRKVIYPTLSALEASLAGSTQINNKSICPAVVNSEMLHTTTTSPQTPFSYWLRSENWAIAPGIFSGREFSNERIQPAQALSHQYHQFITSLSLWQLLNIAVPLCIPHCERCGTHPVGEPGPLSY